VGAATTDLEALAGALEEERKARRALAKEVASLRAELAKLAGGSNAPASEPQASPGDAHEHPFDERALRDAGFGEREAAQLRQRMEAVQLESLYLRDRAVREGWVGTPRFAQELQSLEAKLRDEVGDDRYDWLLYATGQNNRVLVDGVFDSSPASVAGLQSGDAILAYDGARLFAASGLHDATAQGQAGEVVSISLLRNGENVTVYVPRGPLGIWLEEARMRP